MKHLICILISIYSVEKSIAQRVEFCNEKTEECVNFTFSNLEELEKNVNFLSEGLDRLKKEWCNESSN